MKSKYILLIVIGLILAYSSFLRLDNIRNYQVFLGDQGRDVLTVLRMVKGDLVFIGPTASVGGFFLGPFYYYLMTPALIASNFDPVGPAVMVALLSIAATYLCYYFAKNYISTSAGIIAALIFAVSRLVVEYSRSSWNPNVLPFFSLLLVIALAKIIDTRTKRKQWWFVTIGACLGIIIQLHYQAIVMHVFAVGVYLFYLWREHIRNTGRTVMTLLKELAFMLVGVGIFLGPFIAFEIYHSFPNTQNIYRFVFENRGDGFSGGQSYEFIVRDTIYRLFLRLVAGGSDTAAQIAITITVVGFLLAGYAFITRFYDYIIHEKKKESFNADFAKYISQISSHGKFIGFILLIAWFICGVGFWGFYKKSIFDYYYSYMYPLPILMFASAAGLLIEYRSRRLHSTRQRGVAVVLSLALGIFISSLVWLNIKSINTMIQGQQIMRTETVARAIIQHKTDGPYNFALITPGNSDHAYRYFLELWGEEPTPLETEVTTQLIVFCEPSPMPCEPEGNSLWEVAGFGRSSIVGQWQVIGLPLYRLEHIPESKELEGKPAKKG